MRVAILTGGGDCPGLNAVIRAVVRKAERVYGFELVGSRDGWNGLIEGEVVPVTIELMRGTLPRGGTVLGTSRINPFMESIENGVGKVRATVEREGIDAIICVGGEGTLACAREMSLLGFNIVGVPKTIDNDIGGTELTFGFNTAVQVAVEAIDRLHTTAESHDRVMVVEVMGRNVGHIAVHAGIAGGATMTLIPEIPFDIDAVCARLVRRHEGSRWASIVVVAEGARPVPGTIELAEPPVDAFGRARLGGIADVVAAEIERRTSLETRVTRLGYVQRGGTPTAFDRVLATRLGVAAIEAVHQRAWGQMVALRAGNIELVPLEVALSQLKTVDQALIDTAAIFFA